MTQAFCVPHLYVRGLRIFAMFATFACLGDLCKAQSSSGPMVARVEMQLAIGDKIVDIIHKGDMLNVLAAREDTYVIATKSGERAAVDKVNALQLAEAVEVYSELIDDEPKVGQFYTLRASAWWARGEKEKALKDYDKAIQLGYAESHAFSSRGLFHAAMGNTSEALADYSTAIRKAKDEDSEDESAYLNRAAVYVTQKKADLAISDYTEAIRIAPKNALIYRQRAVAFKLAGRFDDAIKDFSHAIELEPKSTVSLMGRGFLWFQRKDHQRAVEDFTAVVELDPTAAQAFNNRGYNYNELGEFAKAIADYDKAIELVPDFGLAYQNKAWLLATCEDPEFRDGKLAVASAKEACKLNNYRQISDMMTLAAAFAETGNFKEAIGWQEKVIDLAQGTQKQFSEKVYAGYKQEKTFIAINEEIESDEKSDAS